MRLVITPTAKASLVAISDYIAVDSPRAAARVVDRILQLADTLAQFPMMGGESPVAGAREIVVPNIPYRIVYEIDRDVLRVLDVIHARRQWPPANDMS